MINRIHAKLHRPERGWDPVPAAHALAYADYEWSHMDDTLLDRIQASTGDFSGQRVLDLGGGPGQYSAALAARGAQVTWHDVSIGYQEIARSRIEELGLAKRVTYSLGYLDDAPHLLPEPFDLVFNRLCWYYSADDSGFAANLFSLTRPGGWIYVDCQHSGTQRTPMKVGHQLSTWLNDRLALKIGHPYPPHGRIARLLQRFPHRQAWVDYRCTANDRVLLQKTSRP